VNALVRRAYSAAVTFTPVIKQGDLEIDILNRTVRAGPVELHLTALEQSVLYLLAANAGRVVSRDEILNVMGCGLRCRKQCGEPPDSQPARTAA
jgi:DNA-binding response OmpR family regulator